MSSTGEFRYSLCGCCGDKPMCCKICLCLPCMAATYKAKLDYSSWLVNCLCASCCCTTCRLRTATIEAYGLHSEPCWKEWCTACWCGCCSTIQCAREIEVSGPPGRQAMV
mmetsp:Transcript_659/g.884  ORF Transcript_659/g.884 Transcript_659/m.884 type:complete len:110 (-) Transcript_659:283-612(-)